MTCACVDAVQVVVGRALRALATRHGVVHTSRLLFGTRVGADGIPRAYSPPQKHYDDLLLHGFQIVVTLKEPAELVAELANTPRSLNHTVVILVTDDGTKFNTAVNVLHERGMRFDTAPTHIARARSYVVLMVVLWLCAASLVV
jgi:hypothetical protein